jgi:hypothetical protein
MTDKLDTGSGEKQTEYWDVSDQNLLSATLMATTAQRLAWLKEAFQLAYASGALKSRRFISKEEWDAMGSSPK